MRRDSSGLGSFATVALLVATLVVGVSSATVTWSAAGDGEWCTAGNWAGGTGVPIAGDVIVIDSAVTVSSGGTTNCAYAGTSLTLGTNAVLNVVMLWSGMTTTFAVQTLSMSGGASINMVNAAAPGLGLTASANGITMTTGSYIRMSPTGVVNAAANTISLASAAAIDNVGGTITCGTLTVSGGGSYIYSSAGISTGNPTTISGGANVTASGQFSGSSLTITGSSFVTVGSYSATALSLSGGSSFVSAGSHAGTSFTISGSSFVSATSMTLSNNGANCVAPGAGVNTVQLTGAFAASGTTTFSAAGSLTIRTNAYNTGGAQTINYGSFSSTFTLQLVGTNAGHRINQFSNAGTATFALDTSPAAAGANTVTVSTNNPLSPAVTVTGGNGATILASGGTGVWCSSRVLTVNPGSAAITLSMANAATFTPSSVVVTGMLACCFTAR